MKCIALVIGINEYDHNKPLRNAEADAIAIADKLEYLKFQVIRLIGKDATYDNYMNTLGEYCECLYSKVDVAILYFAGHGMMANMSDCLLLKDAAEINLHDGITAQGKSIVINDFCKTLRKIGDQIIIVIADACRTSAESYNRGVCINSKFGHNTTVPFQTFLAYATSPGASAGDGSNGHSKYTELLLAEMDKEYQSIETTFKNVRKGLFHEIGDQLPWENSCLVDNFCFNYGQLDPYYGKPYDKSCYIRENFHSENKPFQDIIEGLQQQQEDILRLLISERNNLSEEEQFVIGRWITFLFKNNEEFYVELLKYRNLKFFQYEENHLLNGILYELYFDEEDHIRIDNRPPALLLDLVYTVTTGYNDFSPSVKFIQESTQNKDIDHVPYVIGNKEKVLVSVDLEEAYVVDTDDKEIYSVCCIGYKEEDIKERILRDEDLMVDRNGIIKLIRKELRIPINMIKVEFSKRIHDDNKIWLFEMLDFEEQLSEKLRLETWSDIDCLSELSYVEDVANVVVSSVFWDGDSVIVEDECIADVHLEMDHEPMGNIDLPCSYEAILTERNSIWSIEKIKKTHFDTSKYYN